MQVQKMVSILTSSKLKWIYLGIGIFFVLLFVLGFISRPPRTVMVLATPFEVSSLLKDNLEDAPTQAVSFQVLDPQNEPVSNGLITFEWTEGGRISFQTNLEGVLTMKFEEDFLDQEVMVSTEVEEGEVRVSW